MGGYIVTSPAIVDVIRSYPTSFIFTTALSPVLAAGALASVGHLKTALELRARHQRRASQTKAALLAEGIPVTASESHIVPVMVGIAA